jgi:hypothetical protein
MKLGLLFAAVLLIAGCGAAESVDSSAVPGPDSGTATGTGDDSATGTSTGDDGSSTLPPGPDAGTGGDDGGSTTTQDSGSSGGDDSSTTADSGTGTDDGGSTTADGGSGGGGDDGGTVSTDSGSGGGGDDGGGATTDSGSGNGDDGGVTTADSGSGGGSDSGSGGSADSGSGGNSDGGSCHAPSCVYTQGYYKTHQSSWTVLPVVMGANSYDETACLSLLNDPSTGDASVILAKQFIAAVENGGLCDPNASATLAQAQQWFTANGNGLLPYGIALPVNGCASDHSSVPCQAYWLGQTLDSYNSGLSGTPACQ